MSRPHVALMLGAFAAACFLVGAEIGEKRGRERTVQDWASSCETGYVRLTRKGS